MQTVRSFVGMDVHKATISISVAEDGRNGPVRFIGVIPNQPDDIAKMAQATLEARGARLLQQEATRPEPNRELSSRLLPAPDRDASLPKRETSPVLERT